MGDLPFECSRCDVRFFQNDTGQGREIMPHFVYDVSFADVSGVPKGKCDHDAERFGDDGGACDKVQIMNNSTQRHLLKLQGRNWACSDF